MGESVKTEDTSSREIWSDPYAELPFRSDKYAGNCTEIHLGNRRLTGLRDFGQFKSLGVIWLNDNQLTSFDGLNTNFRIKEIYASNNKMVRLGEESLAHMTFLTKLSLDGNKLDDLENVIEELKPMQHLSDLDLFGNPLAQEDNYRLRVIGELPVLTKLDRHMITAEEREEANAFMAKMAKMANFSLTKKKVVVPKYSPEETQRRADTLTSIISRFREHTFKHRVALESFFIPHDKRKLGKVSNSLFWEVLQETNLNKLLVDEFEKEVLEKHYMGRMDVVAINDAGFTRKSLIHYRRFCEDTLRPEMRRYPDETWKPEMAPEISVSTKDLTKYVTQVKEKTVRLEQTRLREALEASRAAATGGGENVFGDRLAGKKHKCDEHGLSNWEAGELIKIIHSFSGEKADDGKILSMQDCESIMKKMTNFGVLPELGVKKACDSLSCDGTKSSVTMLELKDSLGVSVVSSTEGPIIKWRQLTAAEKEKLATKNFGDASILMDSLLCTNPADDSSDLFKRTTLVSTHATRLRKDVKREKLGPSFVTPAMALKRAPSRADVVILPNLLPDVIKEARQNEELSKADWSQHLSKLGLKGEFLSVAIDRKNRSILKQAAQRLEKEELKKKAALAAITATKKDKDKDKVKEARKPLVPPSDGGPKGWAASTGNVVIG